jgi:hypothetical protein
LARHFGWAVRIRRHTPAIHVTFYTVHLRLPVSESRR